MCQNGGLPSGLRLTSAHVGGGAGHVCSKAPHLDARDEEGGRMQAVWEQEDQFAELPHARLLRGLAGVAAGWLLWL